jgi:hypothetical protein
MPVSPWEFGVLPQLWLLPEASRVRRESWGPYPVLHRMALEGPRGAVLESDWPLVFSETADREQTLFYEFRKTLQDEKTRLGRIVASRVAA